MLKLSVVILFLSGSAVSHLLHLEVLNLLLVMMSTQLHAAIGSSSSDPHIFLDCIMLQVPLTSPPPLPPHLLIRANHSQPSVYVSCQLPL